MTFTSRPNGMCSTIIEREDYSDLASLLAGSRTFIFVRQSESNHPKSLAEACIRNSYAIKITTDLSSITEECGFSIYLAEFDGRLSLIKQVTDSSD